MGDGLMPNECQGLIAEVSDLICRGMEGRGFNPAAELRRDLGALAPETMRLQGLKARSTLRPEAAGPAPAGPALPNVVSNIGNLCN